MKSAYCAAVGAAVLAIASLQPTPGHAQTRVFVAPQGSDSNVCTFAQPCRSFQHAHDTVAAGGEITVLDSAGYGALTITKSVTITNPGGVEAGITVTAGGTAININATSAIDVTLRGLTLEGGGVAANGVAVNSATPGGSFGGSLDIIDCVIKDFTGSGVLVQPSFTSGASPEFDLMVARSFLIKNVVSGIRFPQTNMFIKFLISELIATGNGTAVDLASNAVQGELVNSRLSQNTTGINIAAGAHLFLKNSTVQLNNTTAGEIVNAGTLILADANYVGSLVNNSQTLSDGTNSLTLVGNAIVKVTPQ